MRKRDHSGGFFILGILMIIYGIITKFTPADKLDHALIVYMLILLSIIVWSTIGYFVVLAIDDFNKNLMALIEDAPLGLSFVMTMFFPIYLFYYIKNK